MPRRRLALAVLISSVIVLVSVLLPDRSRGRVQAPARPQRIALPAGVMALELTLGLHDPEPSDWSGVVSSSDGEILLVEPLSPNAEIDGPRWTLRTRRTPARKKQRARIDPVSLRVLVRASSRAEVSFDTPAGDASVTLGSLAYGEPVKLLDGRAQVERIVPSSLLESTRGDDDFPSIARAGDGTVWVAYVHYEHGSRVKFNEVAKGRFDSLEPKHNGDQIRLLRFDGKSWSDPIGVTASERDVWRPSVAVDAKGLVWVVWSEQVEGNWDLRARRFSGAGKPLDDVQRLTQDPGADLAPVLASGGPAPGVWVAWQGWRDGRGDILLAPCQAGELLKPEKVSNSDADDWSPTIAASADDVWVAWDTYDRGNYDVRLRRRSANGLGPVVEIAASPRFEVRPSLALDPQNRPWVAFEQGNAAWGKDYGTRFPGKQGTPLYLDRSIVVRVLDGDQVLQTASPPQSTKVLNTYDDTRIKPDLRERITFPRLAIDAQGRPWLLHRRHPQAKNPVQERWVSFAETYEGDHWTDELAIPDSVNLLDNRPALLPDPQGGLFLVYSTDDRPSGSASARLNRLRSARLNRADAPAKPRLVAAPVQGDASEELAQNPHPNEPEQIGRLRQASVSLGGKTYHLIRGDFHRHTEMSAHRDWDGSLEDFWRYALDAADLDWVGPTDHDYAINIDYLWWITQKSIDLYHHEPRFVTMFTYERSLPFPSGHRNVMFPRRGIRPVVTLNGRDLRFGSPDSGAPDIKNLYAYLEHFGGLCSSHTSATNMGTDWRDNNPDLEPVVEIFQGHRLNYEEKNAPQAPHGPDDAIQGYKPSGFVWNALARGYRLGFQASSDHISTHISYAIALVEEPSRDGLMKALKARHSYAAQDNILLLVSCAEHLMGDELEVQQPPSLEIQVQGTSDIARLVIVRQTGTDQPRYVFSTEPDKPTLNLSWTDESLQPGQSAMYYVRIEQADGKLAWASPLWIHRKP